ncbi:motility associated factor glycosyltransferase family protein [Hydrogenimonas sp.]
MSHFEKNIRALAEKDPALADRLRKIPSNERYEVVADSDPANVHIVDTADYTPLFVGKPIDETLAKLQDFKKYARYPYLYFYGIGNGIFYKLLLANETHRGVFVIEPEPELLYIALNLVDFSEEIAGGRLTLKLAEDLGYDAVARYLSGDPKVFAKVYDLHVLLPYYERYSENIVEVNRLFTRAFEHMAYSFGNDITDSLIGLHHFVQNLPLMVRTPTLHELIKKAPNTDTAVIVSTGPSLSKQLPLLKKIADHVTILCIDASFPILEKEGIRPDIVFSIERVALTGEFYKRTSPTFQEGVVEAVSALSHKELVENAKGTLQLSMRPFGYMKYLSPSDKWGYLGQGMSAANMAYELAALAKFKNIVFIGQDLAYGKEGDSHAKGHTFGEREVTREKAVGTVEGYGGGHEVPTTLVWKLFLNFFEQMIAEANAAGYSRTINATEGGARIRGAEELPFAEVAETIVDKSRTKEPIRLETQPPEIVELLHERIVENTNRAIEVALRVKAKSEEVFLQIMEELEKVEKLHKENRLEEIDFDKLQKIVEKIDEVKQMYDDREFSTAFFDLVQPFIMHQELDLARIQVRDTQTEIEKKAKLLEWIYAHKGWLFSFAGSIDNAVGAIRKGVQNWPEEMRKRVRLPEEEEKEGGQA